MIQLPELKTNVQNDSGESFRLIPALTLIFLILTFVGTGIYIMVSSFF
jgi:hypothetical protein